MGNILGGFKNMLKRWRINLKNKKKKELESEFDLKKSKRQSFLYGFLAILIYPFGMLFGKSISDKKNIKSVDKKNATLKPNISPVVEVLNEKKNVVEPSNIKQNISKLSVSQENIYAKNLMFENNKIVNNISAVNKLFDVSKMEVEDINFNNIETNDISYIDINNVVEQNINSMTNQNIVNDIGILISDKKDDEKKENVIISEDVKKENIKDLNYKLNGILIEVEWFDNKIGFVTKYNDLYYIQNELNYLKNKVELIKEEYEQLDIKTEELYDFDNFELHKDGVKIEELKKHIDNVLNKINDKKDELISVKDETKVEKKKESKKEVKKEKEEKKKEKNNKVDEYSLIKQIIIQDIINQQKYLDKNLKKINNRTTMLGYIGRSFRNLVNFNLVLMPTGIIFNPLLFTLVNSFLVTNSLKTIRKLMNPNFNINYEMLLDDYMDNKNIILKTFENYNECLEQINNIQNDLINVNADVEILKDVESVKKNILNQIENLKEKENTMDKVYVKLKRN